MYILNALARFIVHWHGWDLAAIGLFAAPLLVVYAAIYVMFSRLERLYKAAEERGVSFPPPRPQQWWVLGFVWIVLGIMPWMPWWP